jgi:hypothetical protein
MSGDHWIKVLADGTTEYGYDKDIQDKGASWTKGRQDIVSAVVTLGNRKVSLVCPMINNRVGTWEQLDHYICSLNLGEGKRIARELSCNTLEHKFLQISVLDDSIVFNVNSLAGKPIPDNTNRVYILLKDSGQIQVRFGVES